MTFVLSHRLQSITYAVRWMNELQSAAVPGYEDYGVDRIIQFQILPCEHSYEVVVLVEASKFI